MHQHQAFAFVINTNIIIITKWCVTLPLPLLMKDKQQRNVRAKLLSQSTTHTRRRHHLIVIMIILVLIMINVFLVWFAMSLCLNILKAALRILPAPHHRYDSGHQHHHDGQLDHQHHLRCLHDHLHNHENHPHFLLKYFAIFKTPSQLSRTELYCDENFEYNAADNNDDSFLIMFLHFMVREITSINDIYESGNGGFV